MWPVIIAWLRSSQNVIATPEIQESVDPIYRGDVLPASIGLGPRKRQFHVPAPLLDADPTRVKVWFRDRDNSNRGRVAIQRVEGSRHVFRQPARSRGLQQQKRRVPLIVQCFYLTECVLENRPGRRVVVGQLGRSQERHVRPVTPSRGSNLLTVGRHDTAIDLRAELG
jgi:hypothetical protein